MGRKLETKMDTTAAASIFPQMQRDEGGKKELSILSFDDCEESNSLLSFKLDLPEYFQVKLPLFAHSRIFVL